MTNRAKKIIIIAVAVIALCGLSLVGVFGGAAIVGWKAATRAGNEAATIQNLKTIAAVEIQYFNTHKRSFGTFDQLVSEQFLSSKFAGHPTIKDGYVFHLSLAHNVEGSSSFRITADPQDESEGRKHFYFDSNDDRIRVNSERQAAPDDPISSGT